jgi:molybdopterin molybdotransferase
VVADELVPPRPTTAFDGFAVRAEDVTGASADRPVELEVVGTVAAGAVLADELRPGQAARIMTGAPLPAGADTIVMVEDSRAGGDGRVLLLAAPRPGDHVRGAGDDVRPGDLIVPAGTALTPAHLGVLASLGVTEVAAHPRPRVGVISTGDELVEGPVPLGPGQIRDSNRVTLLSLLAELGAVPVDLGLVRDREELVAAAFAEGAASCDAILSSGGVSMGDFDMVKVVLSRLGEMSWMQIAIKPAKPFSFGHVDGCPVFGLPGNPVSSMVSYELLARPALRRMMGHGSLDRPRVLAVCPEGLRRGRDGKVHFLRAHVRYAEGRYEVRSAGAQGSHQLSVMASANALAIVPDGDGVAPGASVEVMVLRAPFD